MKMSNAKLDALLKREQALKAAIAQEKVRQQARQLKDQARLAAVVGRALLDHGAKVPDFELLIKQTLKTAVKDPSSREFLSSLGWL